ncbi:hypothetical protein KXS05_20605 [Rhizobium sp. SA279]|uniref:hypothetical protein n=1 Tax=Agrobacterium deltaense TaxID=1183412 RepID=UPI000F63C736|nr:hypothetical protein [Agrobacterium deltaense]RRN75576.1 hypothetical protein EIQ31_00205 [Agrobacterium deltaense]
MKQPPRDDANKVVPHDHEEIDNDDFLIRRIDPRQHIVQDDNLNCRRLSSKAFQPSSEDGGGMSVDIEKLILADGIDPATYVTSPKYVGSIRFSAEAARSASLLVGYDPLSDNPYHGEVWGENKPNRFSRTQQRAICTASNWLVQIPNVEIADF